MILNSVRCLVRPIKTLKACLQMGHMWVGAAVEENYININVNMLMSA